MSTRENLHPAYVIHTRAFRDTSLIVEVFTPEFGRMSLLARGAKTGKSKKAQILQPFRSLHVSWVGRGELPVLAVAEEAGGFLHLQGVALACGYYVNELIYYLLPRHEPATQLFAQYWTTLESVNNASDRDGGLRQFEYSLLEQIGYTPQLTYDTHNGEAVSRQKSYRYLIPDDLRVVENPLDSGIAGQLGIAVSGETLLDISENKFANPVSPRETRNIMRALIHYHLDGRELISRSLFSSFQDLSSAEN